MGSALADDARATSSDDLVSTDDVATMNGVVVGRAAAFTRIAGSVVVVAAAVGTLAWAWLAVRAQQTLDPSGGSVTDLGPDDPSLQDRVDAFAAYASVGVTAVLAFGSGLLMRLAADYTVARTGGSLTGYQGGDVLRPDES